MGPYSPSWPGRGAWRYAAFRYSCVNANACKECTVRVDGKIGYACTKRLATGAMTVEPLANMRLIRDRVTDIVLPKERLARSE